MSSLQELADKLISDLQSATEPDPLLVDLWGMSPGEAAILVKQIADHHTGDTFKLHSIELDHAVGEELGNIGVLLPCMYRGIYLQADDGVGAWLAFHRREPSAAQ